MKKITFISCIMIALCMIGAVASIHITLFMTETIEQLRDECGTDVVLEGVKLSSNEQIRELGSSEYVSSYKIIGYNHHVSRYYQSLKINNKHSHCDKDLLVLGSTEGHEIIESDKVTIGRNFADTGECVIYGSNIICADEVEAVSLGDVIEITDTLGGTSIEVTVVGIINDTDTDNLYSDYFVILTDLNTAEKLAYENASGGVRLKDSTLFRAMYDVEFTLSDEQNILKFEKDINPNSNIKIYQVVPSKDDGYRVKYYALKNMRDNSLFIGTISCIVGICIIFGFIVNSYKLKLGDFAVMRLLGAKALRICLIMMKSTIIPLALGWVIGNLLAIPITEYLTSDVVSNCISGTYRLYSVIWLSAGVSALTVCVEILLTLVVIGILLIIKNPLDLLKEQS